MARRVQARAGCALPGRRRPSAPEPACRRRRTMPPVSREQAARVDALAPEFPASAQAVDDPPSSRGGSYGGEAPRRLRTLGKDLLVKC